VLYGMHYTPSPHSVQALNAGKEPYRGIPPCQPSGAQGVSSVPATRPGVQGVPHFETESTCALLVVGLDSRTAYVRLSFKSIKMLKSIFKEKKYSYG
jgi:hypothetical protein